MRGALALLLLGFLPGCDLLDQENDSSRPITPDTFMGRDVMEQGTVYVADRDVTLNVWDSGQIDGDIISLYVNGRPVVSQQTLSGSKRSYRVQLNRSGYSYILLYAHNEGSIPPNTAAVSIDDGYYEQTLVLSADLSTNGAYNIVVE